MFKIDDMFEVGMQAAYIRREVLLEYRADFCPAVAYDVRRLHRACRVRVEIAEHVVQLTGIECREIADDGVDLALTIGHIVAPRRY